MQTTGINNAISVKVQFAILNCKLCYSKQQMSQNKMINSAMSVDKQSSIVLQLKQINCQQIQNNSTKKQSISPLLQKENSKQLKSQMVKKPTSVNSVVQPNKVKTFKCQNFLNIEKENRPKDVQPQSKRYNQFLPFQINGEEKQSSPMPKFIKLLEQQSLTNLAKTLAKDSDNNKDELSKDLPLNNNQENNVQQNQKQKNSQKFTINLTENQQQQGDNNKCQRNKKLVELQKYFDEIFTKIGICYHSIKMRSKDFQFLYKHQINKISDFFDFMNQTMKLVKENYLSTIKKNQVNQEKQCYQHEQQLSNYINEMQNLKRELNKNYVNFLHNLEEEEFKQRCSDYEQKLQFYETVEKEFQQKTTNLIKYSQNKQMQNNKIATKKCTQKLQDLLNEFLICQTKNTKLLKKDIEFENDSPVQLKNEEPQEPVVAQQKKGSLFVSFENSELFQNSIKKSARYQESQISQISLDIGKENLGSMGGNQKFISLLERINQNQEKQNNFYSVIVRNSLSNFNTLRSSDETLGQKLLVKSLELEKNSSNYKTFLFGNKRKLAEEETLINLQS